MVVIKAATDDDFEQIWKIFREVISGGDTYVFDPNMNRDEAYKRWMAPYMSTYVAEIDDEILGTYIIKANQEGLGSHVANGSYMVLPSAHGKGIGKLMGEHSIVEAKKQGYKAMQYNMVVSSNIGAIKLWESLGFEIVGTLPKAFNHIEQGLIDVFVMYRSLED